MTIVTFDYTAWSTRFPEFSNVTQQQADELFIEACQFINNTDCSPIGADPTTFQPRALILNYTVAHLAKLFFGTAADGAPTSLVGRLAAAAEGSVNVATELAGQDSPTRDWWTQTPYGFSVWQLTAPYRIGVYIAPPAEFAGPPFPFASPFGRVF